MAERSVTAIEKSPFAGRPSGVRTAMSSVTLRRRPGSREAEIVAGVEDQPLGEGLARRFVEEQHLKQPLGQLLAAEGERWHQRIPRLVVALRAAAVHHEPQSARQPVASRTDGDYEGRVGGVDAQHEGIVLGHRGVRSGADVPSGRGTRPCSAVRHGAGTPRCRYPHGVCAGSR